MGILVLLLPNALVLITGLVALRVGGGPEKAAALALATWAAIDPIYRVLFGGLQFARFDPALLVFDSALMLTLALIAIGANRVWPIFAAAASLLPLGGHLAALVNPHGMKMAYWAINQVPFLLILLCILSGTLLHWRRRCAKGDYPDWTDFG